MSFYPFLLHVERKVIHRLINSLGTRERVFDPKLKTYAGKRVNITGQKRKKRAATGNPIRLAALEEGVAITILY